MDAPSPTIEESDQRLIIRLPRRVGSGYSFLLAFPVAALFLWFPVVVCVSIFFPKAIPSHTTFSGPSSVKPIGYAIFAAFLGVFVLFGVRLIPVNIIRRFGHAEIHVWLGSIRRYERLGFLRWRATRPITTLIRLNVEPAQYARKSNIENEMELMAYFADAMPFPLAHNYNREQLLAAAKQLQRALPQFGAAAKVVVGGPPPLSRNEPATLAQPILITPPKRTRIKLERPAQGGVRFIVPGLTWWAAALLLVIVASALTYVLINPFVRNSLEASFPHSFRGTIDVVTLVLIAVGTLLSVYLITRDVILEANANELKMTSMGFLGQTSRRWATADIDRLEIEVRTHSGGKGGGPRTSRSLALVPKKGWRKRYFSTQSVDNLEWLQAELSGAMWPRASTQRKSIATPPAANIKPQRPPRWFGVLFTAFACIFIVSGWWCAIAQDHRLRHGRQVQATITLLESGMTTGKNGNLGYKRILHYQYTVAGQTYQSTEFFPVNMSGQAESNLLDAFYDSIAGRSIIQAWYVDDDPSRAYLIHERSFSPYFMIFFANVFFLAGLVIALPPIVASNPESEQREANRRAMITITWLIMGIAAAGHYLLQWPTHWHLDFLIIMAIWIIIAISLIAWWHRAPANPISTDR